MSQINVDNIRNRLGGAIGAPSGIVVTGVSTFSGDVSIGGTLTYEDVTNIDSVGVITARSGLVIGGDANNGVAEGFKLDANGLMQVSRGDGVSALFAGYTQGSSTQTSRINNNGNAYFLGNVGVGTNNPGQKLHVLGDGSTAVQVSDGTNNQYFASVASAGNFSNGSVVGDALIRGQSGFAVSPNNGSSVAFRVTSAGNVGVNQSSPAVLFHASKSYSAPTGGFDSNIVAAFTNSGSDSYAGLAIQGGSGSGTFIHFGDTDDSNVGVINYEHSDNSFRVTTNTSEKMRLDSSGRLLVGKTSSTSDNIEGTGYANLVQIEGAAIGAGLQVKNATNTARINLIWKEAEGSLSTGDKLGAISFGAGDSTSVERARIEGNAEFTNANGRGGQLKFLTCNDSDHVPTERLRITNAGNVSIGGMAANAFSNYTTLTMGGAGAVTGSGIDFERSDGNTYGRIYGDNNGLQLAASQSGDYIRFELSGGSERFRVTAVGQHHMFSDNTVIYARSNSTSYNDYLFYGQNNASSLTSGGTVQIQIQNDGDIKNTDNSYGAISDIKLKENIVDASSQWDDIKALRVRNYNFKEGTGYNTHKQLGLIAQELEPICPGLVDQSPDLDDDGNDLGTVTKSVNYSVLYMKAIKGLQEAMTKIETLESKVAALEG